MITVFAVIAGNGHTIYDTILLVAAIEYLRSKRGR